MTENAYEKVTAAVDMLKAGKLLQVFAPPGEAMQPLLLRNGDDEGAPARSPLARFRFYHEEYLEYFIRMGERWNGIVTATANEPEVQGTLLRALVDKREWDELVRSTYDATAPLMEVLRGAVDEYKSKDLRGVDDAEAEIAARKAYPHLAMVEDFRKKAEVCLGITPAMARAR